jgi:hypothetical protein
MAHCYAVAQNQRVFVFHHVTHAAVLNIGARADANVMNVAANHGAGPHARMFADGYVAYHHGGSINVSSWRDLGRSAFVFANQYFTSSTLRGKKSRFGEIQRFLGIPQADGTGLRNDRKTHRTPKLRAVHHPE